MDVNCEGCAGCCIDWRPIAADPPDHERSGPRPPLDDAYNLVPLLRDEVREFVDAGLGDALTPRLFRARDEAEAVTIDGFDLAAVEGRPAFYVGFRKPPKPVGPFGTDRRWLRTCAFLDPETLQCRLHDAERYPAACADYPGENLRFDADTECERVEREYGGDRLRDATPPERLRAALVGPQALGGKVFVHPDPDRLRGVVARAAASDLTAADRAEFVGAAVASSPGTAHVDEGRAAEARERALAADSWVGRAVADWEARAGATGDDATDAAGDAATVEDDRGAPGTPGW